MDDVSRPVRLLICDDHRVLADALARVVEADSEFRLVCEPVGDAEAAVALCVQHRPDVVLMDIQLTGAVDGIEATRRIKEVSPETNVVVMSGYRKQAAVLASVQAGAVGFLDKTESIEELLEVVRAAAAGELVIDAGPLSRLLCQEAAAGGLREEATEALSRLTEREREVLRLLAQGLRTEAIAERLYISARTVQTHVQRILTKLGVHSRLEAVAIAARANKDTGEGST
jgi:DNA-binding NarL/FixJ family response regulator